MQKRILTAIVLFAVLIQACKEKCTLNCSCMPSLETTGYAANELDTVIVRTFLPDSTFSSLVDSFVLTPTAQPWWAPVNNKNNDTFVFSYNNGGYYILDYITYTKDMFYDFEVVVPADNRIYKITGLKLNGPKTNQITCKGGSVSENTPCNSRQYISSYNIDGNTISFPAFSNFRFIYLNK